MRYAYIPHTPTILTCLQVHIVYSKRSLFPFPDPSRPFSWWGTIMFFLGLATQVVFVAIGIFQLYENGPEFLWAFPIVSHIHMVAISTCIFRMCQKFPDEDYKRIRLWFCVSWAAFILSLILFVLAILDMWKHHAALQCTFCMSLVEVQARVDGKHKNLDQACCVLTIGIYLLTLNRIARVTDQRTILNAESTNSLRLSRATGQEMVLRGKITNSPWLSRATD